MGYKWLGEDKIHVPSIMDYDGWEKDVIDDKKLVRDFHKVMMEADMLVGFYSKGFDLPWIQSKFLEYNLPVLPLIPHVDLYYVARSNLRLGRKSLDNISSFMKLGSKKYYVSGSIWKRARIGDPAALDKVVKHCHADIVLTEKLYLKLRPLVRQHPRLNGWLPCANCGGSNLQRRGYAITRTQGKKIRVWCRDCGSWENRSESHAEIAND